MRAPQAFPDERLLETEMYRAAKTQSRRNDSHAVRTVFASAFGLTPVAVVSGMMVMQMLGLWTY